jgi:fatty acid synthase subunit alpha, fungi type
VQIALVITSRAAFEDMRLKGLVQPGAAFAGHSLGEFSALAAVADILPNSSLVDIVFYRGPTMQHAVERDEQGRSNYAVCAVNPSRVGKAFDDAALRAGPAASIEDVAIRVVDILAVIVCQKLKKQLSD